MKPQLFKVGVTYSIATPESVEFGDYHDAGWAEPMAPASLREALSTIKDHGIDHVETCAINRGQLAVYGFSYTENYRTGAERQNCVHIDGPIRALKRLARLLTERAEARLW